MITGQQIARDIQDADEHVPDGGGTNAVVDSVSVDGVWGLTLNRTAVGELAAYLGQLERKVSQAANDYSRSTRVGMIAAVILAYDRQVITRARACELLGCDWEELKQISRDLDQTARECFAPGGPSVG